MPLLTFFIFGVLASLGALLVELFVASFLIDTTNLRGVFIPTTLSLFLFALIEESCKILFFLRALNHLATPAHFLRAGIVFGLGFAGLEYFSLAYIQNLPSGPLYGILLVHIITSILLALTLSRYRSRTTLLILLTLLTTLHFGYNILL